MRVPVSLHSHQYLLLFLFLIEVIIFDEAAICKPVCINVYFNFLRCSLSRCNIYWHFYKNVHHELSTKIKNVMNNNNSSTCLVFTNFIF